MVKNRPNQSARTGLSFSLPVALRVSIMGCAFSLWMTDGLVRPCVIHEWPHMEHTNPWPH